MPYDFASDWMMAKTLFETATGKKKPSKKFLGKFRLSSGVEDACKDLEKAIAQPSADRILKAEKKFNKAAEDYLDIIREAAEEDGATDRYKSELTRLEAALEKIRLDFSKAKREETHDMPEKFGDIVPDEFVDGVAESVFPTNVAVKNFALKPEWVVSAVDPKKKLPDAVAAQKIAQEALKKYILAMKAMKAQTKVKMDRKEAWAKASELIGDAAEAVGHEGIQKALAYWKNAQEAAFHEVGRRAEFRAWLEGGPLTVALKAAADAVTAELLRLNRLESKADEQAR
ncbi:MAG: hypothetical protein K8U03_20450 [Planctomycetia bacterium]|nr:hypothetical protein [Planctomycetia bacterium]